MESGTRAWEDEPRSGLGIQVRQSRHSLVCHHTARKFGRNLANLGHPSPRRSEDVAGNRGGRRWRRERGTGRNRTGPDDTKFDPKVDPVLLLLLLLLLLLDGKGEYRPYLVRTAVLRTKSPFKRGPPASTSNVTLRGSEQCTDG
jgi:hypothetical protein